MFARDLRRGLGSAILTLRSDPDPGRYAPTVREACLNLTLYDGPCEGRVRYLYDAIALTGAGAEIEAAIIDRFARCSPSTWLYSQLAELLKRFAFDGSDAAYEALWAGYRRMLRIFARHRRSGTWWQGMSQFEALGLVLVDLNGRQAFGRFVIDVVRAWGPDRGPEDDRRWFPGWFHAAARGKLGEERVDEFLAGAPPGDFAEYAAHKARSELGDGQGRRRVAAPEVAPDPADPAQREVALEALRTGNVAEGLRLLTVHYRRCDDALIDRAVRAVPVRQSGLEWHKVYWRVLDLYKVKWRRLPATGLVEYTYRETLCSFCRGSIVRLLHRKGRLTDDLVREACWDSCDELAEFARRVARGRGIKFEDPLPAARLP
jgi:hypothetical protein